MDFPEIQEIKQQVTGTIKRTINNSRYLILISLDSEQETFWNGINTQMKRYLLDHNLKPAEEDLVKFRRDQYTGEIIPETAHLRIFLSSKITIKSHNLECLINQKIDLIIKIKPMFQVRKTNLGLKFMATGSSNESISVQTKREFRPMLYGVEMII